MARRPSRRRTRRQPGASDRLAPQVPLARALANGCADLAARDVAFALVGGLAVSARAEPRLTRDVDLAIAIPDDAAAEALIVELVAAGYRVVSTVEQTKTGRLATVRLVPPGDPGLVIDLLFASCGIEPEIVKAAQRIEILPGLEVPVARTGHLIAMKLLARDDRTRPQDLDDLRALLAVAKPADRRLVLAAIEQIADRGFARGRDLLALWRDITA